MIWHKCGHRNDIASKFQLKYQKGFSRGSAHRTFPLRLRPFNVLWQAIEQNIKRGVSFSLPRRHTENEKAFSLRFF
jgi:hypothetical protein